jgi:uncharacterized repeat protein (TIGR03806 family)
MLSALLVASLAGCDQATLDSRPSGAPWEFSRPPNPTCLAPERPRSQWDVGLGAAFGGRTFARPVGMVPSPERPGMWTVIQQQGAVIRISDDGMEDTVMFTVPDVYMGSSELGLLGFAWHPQAAENHEAFVNYTTLDGSQLRSHIARVRATDDFLTLQASTFERILSIDQPYENHNGGNLAFGPDGLLYAGFGDGGSGGDPSGNAQNRSVLLGKMLRIDVDAGATYGIPFDNPFAGGGGAPEVYAWGLRNPWRFFFDPDSGALWVGDVGQRAWEEIDLVERGGDYGWNDMEGTHCYNPAEGCNTEGKILPVAEYAHDGDGKASVTGGPVYRGSAIPALDGVALFADVYSGTISGLFADPITGEYMAQELVPASGTLPVSFGQGTDGEVYVVDYAGGLFQLVATTTPGAGDGDPFPTLLSATGCFRSDAPTVPVPAMFPYDVNSPLWSDGATKRRWFALPDGTTPAVTADGHLDLPVGSVVVKEFALDGTPVETRLLVRHDDGNWAGYSYQWRADGSDAELLAAAASVDWAGGGWDYPSRGECLACHTAATGRVLGLTGPQLDRDYTYEWGTTTNQIDQLTTVGLLELDPDSVAALPSPDGDASTEARARAYLDVNCAGCHRPGGTGLGAFDLRYETATADGGLCDAPPVHGDLGVPGARIVLPGQPESSILSLRMHATDANRMPGIGSNIVDPSGTTLIDQWITALESCP